MTGRSSTRKTFHSTAWGQQSRQRMRHPRKRCRKRRHERSMRVQRMDGGKNGIHAADRASLVAPCVVQIHRSGGGFQDTYRYALASEFLGIPKKPDAGAWRLICKELTVRLTIDCGRGEVPLFLEVSKKPDASAWRLICQLRITAAGDDGDGEPDAAFLRCTPKSAQLQQIPNAITSMT